MGVGGLGAQLDDQALEGQRGHLQIVLSLKEPGLWGRSSRGIAWARIDRRDLAGLKALGADDPQAERLLLSLAPEPMLIDGIRCEPPEP